MHKMKNESRMAAPTGAAIRFCRGILAVFLLVALLSTAVFAVWDGSGFTGDENVSSVIGGFSMPTGSEADIIGYRFTVHDSSGVKIGESVDFNRIESPFDTLYRSFAANKRSHVELYKEYLDKPNSIKLGNFKSLGLDDTNVFYDSTLPATPTEVEGWLTQTKAQEIAANYCLASSYNYETCYIIIEPVIMATLAGDHYAMTMAEFAVYQSSLYGWDSLGSQDSGVSGTYRNNVMRMLSAVIGRYLYATGDYRESGVFDTAPPLASYLKTDAKGADSMLMGSSDRYNTAANVLMYQVGFGTFFV